MEPDTLSPYSSVISTVCNSVHYLFVIGVGVRVWLCVFSLKCVCPSMCVYVQKIRINLDPQLFHPPSHPSSPCLCLCVCLSPCYLVIAVLVGPFGHCVWVSLVKVCMMCLQSVW